MKDDEGPEKQRNINEQQCLVQTFLENPGMNGRLIEKPLTIGVERGIQKVHKKLYNWRGEGFSREEIKDLFQRAFLHAFKALTEGQWKAKAPLENWAYRIGSNIATDVARKKDQESRIYGGTFGTIDHKSTSYTSNNTEENSIDEERFQGNSLRPEFPLQVNEMFMKATPLEKRVIELCQAEGNLSIPKIAFILNEEKIWGKMYPQKVRNILENLLREYL